MQGGNACMGSLLFIAFFLMVGTPARTPASMKWTQSGGAGGTASCRGQGAGPLRPPTTLHTLCIFSFIVGTSQLPML